MHVSLAFDFLFAQWVIDSSPLSMSILRTDRHKIWTLKQQTDQLIETRDGGQIETGKYFFLKANTEIPELLAVLDSSVWLRGGTLSKGQARICMGGTSPLASGLAFR